MPEPGPPLGVPLWSTVMTWSSALQKARTPWVIIPILLVLILAFGIFWFLHNFEKKPFEEIEGGSPSAGRNPLLAAHRYLQFSGKDVTDYRGLAILSDLPSPVGALYIHRLPRGLSASISNNLFAWVESGGHLLLAPNAWQSEKPGTDDILSRLGVHIQKEETDCGCPPKSKTEPKTAVKKNTPEDKGIKAEAVGAKTDKNQKGYHPSDSIIEVTIDDFPIRLKYFGTSLLEDKNGLAAFKINGSYRINYRNEADHAREDNKTIKDKEGNWMLQYMVGAGKITILSENVLFTNKAIGDYDHAFLLSWLLKNDHTVRLLSTSEAKGLAAIVWEQTPQFWVSLFAVVALILLRLQNQSGTLLQIGTDEQLNILAHIDASGMFSWRMNKASTILAANRRSMLQHWSERKRVLGQEFETRHMSASTLAAKTGFPEKEVFDAFRLRIEGEQDLIKSSRALQKMYRRLYGGESRRHDG